MFILPPCKPTSNFTKTIFQNSYSSLPFIAKYTLSQNTPKQQPHNVVYPDEHLHTLLTTCTKAQTHKAVQSFHGLTVTLGPYARQPIYFTNNVVSLYAKLNDLVTARKVFDGMVEKNVVSYNGLISVYSRKGYGDDAWGLFCRMWRCGVGATGFTFGGLVSCCDMGVERGGVVHGLMVKCGVFWCDPHGGTALIGLYGRNGCVDEAVRVFEDMEEKSLVTWNSIISVLGHHGFVQEGMVLLCELMRLGNWLSGSTLVGLLSGFVGREGLEVGKQIHSLVVKTGFDCEVSTSNALLNMYVKCLDLASAERLFSEVPCQDVVTYNILIGALARGDRPFRGLELLLCLFAGGNLPNITTYVGVIGCCTHMRNSCFGEYIHAKVIKNSFHSDVYVGTALVGLYGKWHRLDSARRCFNDIADKNVVSWNSLIVAYSCEGDHKSTQLLKEMLQWGYYPNEYTLSSALKSSSFFELLQIHCLAAKMGYLKNEFVFSSLLTSYAMKGIMSDALLIATSVVTPHSLASSNAVAATYSRAGQYDKSLETLAMLDEPDIVSWNILISTCSHNGHHREAFELFKHMLEVQIIPDNYTVVNILSGCSSLCSLAFGRSIHGFLIKTNTVDCDTFVCNMLMDMYAKCGNIEDSLEVFRVTSERKNIITWTTLISALGHHGFSKKALGMFKEMETLGFKPDDVSFIAVLSACRHGGLVKEGMEMFSRMQKVYGIEPKMDHYHGVVDLLARHGYLKEAEQVIASMPFPPNAPIWRTFLGGCKRWENTETCSRSLLT